MKKITLEINAGDYLCESCGYKHWVCGCILFQTVLAKDVHNKLIRCQSCINAENPQHKISESLHGQEY